MTQTAHPDRVRSAAYQSFWLLRIGFTAAPILFGIDKFSNWTVHWPDYLAGWINDLAPGSAQDFKRAWQGREIPLEPDAWSLFSSAEPGPGAQAEQSELLQVLGRAIEEVLTQHQRRVLVALALNEVPIDVLAERLSTTRDALYKTLHDARRKLRKHLADSGLAAEAGEEVS